MSKKTSDLDSSQWPTQIAVIACCVLVFVLSLWISFVTCNGEWTARSGGLIVVGCTLFESWTVLTTKRVGDLLFWNTQTGHTAVRVSIWMICFGTLVQTFGGMSSGYFPKC